MKRAAGEGSSGGPRKKVPKGSLEHKIERRNYLRQLLNEFETSKSKDARLQVLGNLANFAYDPYNYDLFRELEIIPVLLGEIKNSKLPEHVEFAAAAICNCSSDSKSGAEIIKYGGLDLLKGLLTNNMMAIVASALTALMYLICNSQAGPRILDDELKERLKGLTKYGDKRVANLSRLFLMDYFGISE